MYVSLVPMAKRLSYISEETLGFELLNNVRTVKIFRVTKYI